MKKEPKNFFESGSWALAASKPMTQSNESSLVRGRQAFFSKKNCFPSKHPDIAPPVHQVFAAIDEQGGAGDARGLQDEQGGAGDIFRGAAAL